MAGAARDLVLLLTRAERMLSRRLASCLDEYGLSIEAWRVLNLLSDGAGHPMSEVAEYAMLPPASLTRLADQLVENGLVYRRSDPADRRRVLAFLSRRGQQLTAELAGQVEDAIGQLEVPDPDGLSERLADLVAMLEPGVARRTTASPRPGR